MKGKHWLKFGPSFVLALGIIMSSAIGVLTMNSAWLVGAGPLLFALLLVAADMLDSRLRGESIGPTRKALFLAVVFLVACGIVALADPTYVAMVIPILAAGPATSILVYSGGRHRACGRL
jgi:hypothetical protein